MWTVTESELSLIGKEIHNVCLIQGRRVGGIGNICIPCRLGAQALKKVLKIGLKY